MNKAVIYFLAVLFLYCCSERKQKPGGSSSDISVLDSTALNDTTKKILLLESELIKLASMPDSLSAYIRLNNLLFDSVTKWRNRKEGNKYLDAIIEKHVLIESDTALRGILTKAYIFWGGINYTEAYNDTLVTRLEQFLILDQKDSSLRHFRINAYNYLGVQYHVLGDLKKTGYYYTLYRQAAKERNSYEYVVSATNDIAIALNEQHYYDSSIQLINEILPAKEIQPRRKAGLYTNLAEAFAGKQQYDEGIQACKQGFTVLEKAIASGQIDSSDYYDYQYQLLWSLADIQTEQSSYDEAIKNFTEAFRYLALKFEGDLKTRQAGKLFLAEGRLYERKGDLKKALQLYHKGLSCVTKVDSSNTSQIPGINEIYTENTIMESLDSKAGVLSKIFSSINDTIMLQQAVGCYELAFAVESKLLQGFSYDESIMRQSKESKQRSEKAIAACYQLYTLTHSSVWSEKAFLFAEKSKAITLQESVKRNIAATGSVQQDTNWQQVQHFQQQVNFYEKEIAITNDTARIKIFELSLELKKAEENLLLAKTALQHSNSSYREALLKTDSLSITHVKNNMLDKSTALIEFFSGDSSSYIFILTKNLPLLFIKATDSLATSINHVLQFYTDKNKINNEPEAYQAAAYQLYQQTSLSAIDNDKIKKLVIIPDGQLNFVPFDALVTSIKPQQNPRMFSYLLHQKQISYGYSVATLLKQAGNNAATSGSGLSLFAPVFANKERGKSSLLHSLEEADAIKKENSSGKFYLKEQAGISQFKKSVSNAGIIHIASHASADTGSGLQPLIDFYDSSLYLNEIYSMHMAPRLVVLSACETGIGIIDKSEGAMSLARAFYYAGAKNIITSLWSVDDKSTATLFSRFYADIKNDDYSRALYDSKLNYIKNATSSTASPYYWAGFIHIGNQKPPGNYNRAVFIISILAIAILSFFILRKRR
jgi:CHAT domain-containing protein